MRFVQPALAAGEETVEMLDFFKSLRRSPAEDHREVFAEFAMVMIFLHAEHRAARRGRARLRVVR